MTGVERRLLELVEPAEAPLYSAYCWLGDELGRAVSLDEFLRVVDRLVKRASLRLWSVDVRTQTREQLHGVPERLGDRYRSLDDLDEQYDPFALSLTAAPDRGLSEGPEWEVDLDFANQAFEIVCVEGREQEALAETSNLYPDLRFLVSGQKPDAERIRVVGKIVPTDR